MIMMNFIEIVLCHFESCFSRKAAFRWFVTITVDHMQKDATVSCASHVIQMAEDAYQAAMAFGDCLLLLDRYFLTVPVLEKAENT